MILLSAAKLRTRSGDGGGIGSLPHDRGRCEMNPVRIREAETAAAIQREREPRAAIGGLHRVPDLAVGGESQIARAAGSYINVQAGRNSTTNLYRDGDRLGRIDRVGIAHRDDAGRNSRGQTGCVQNELQRRADTRPRRAVTLRAHRTADPGNRRRELQRERTVGIVIRFDGLRLQRVAADTLRDGNRTDRGRHQAQSGSGV